MHEMAIVQSVIDIVLQEMDRHGVEKLKTIHLAIGRMSAIVPEQMKMCFDILTTDHKLAGANLNIREVPLTYRCRDCDQEFTSEGITFNCPYCEGRDPEIIFGRELKIESIEVMD
jgi:hydrogenase nickel incorporation protein HypA/HybF